MFMCSPTLCLVSSTNSSHISPLIQDTLLQKVISLERQVREAQNVVDEKEEEMYMLTEKVEELVRVCLCLSLFSFSFD